MASVGTRARARIRHVGLELVFGLSRDDGRHTRLRAYTAGEDDIKDGENPADRLNINTNAATNKSSLLPLFQDVQNGPPPTRHEHRLRQPPPQGHGGEEWRHSSHPQEGPQGAEGRVRRVLPPLGRQVGSAGDGGRPRRAKRRVCFSDTPVSATRTLFLPQSVPGPR